MSIVFPNLAKEVLTGQLHLPAGAISLQIIDGIGRMMKTMLLQSSGSTLSTAIGSIIFMKAARS